MKKFNGKRGFIYETGGWVYEEGGLVCERWCGVRGARCEVPITEPALEIGICYSQIN